MAINFSFLLKNKFSNCIFIFCDAGERLNTFVSHFEPLNYDINVLENRHQRVRRSLDQESTLHLDFKAHGRYC
jgi:disintegrin and metalloproteinase domain-containing protein 10